MRSDVVLLFPGQGGYVPGALGALIDDFPETRAQLETIDAVCAQRGIEPVSTLLTDPNARSLTELVRQRSESLDLTLFTAAFANFHILRDLGVTADVLLGHSFGELAALTAADVFSVSDAVRLAGERAAGLRSDPPPSGGMLALTIDARRAASLADFVDSRNLSVAVDNGPDQCVVSGTDSALARLREAATALGVSATRIPAAYPFHNEVLRRNAEDLDTVLESITARLPRIPVYSSVLGRYVDSLTDVRSLVGHHLTKPVDFYGGLRRVHRDGARIFVEVGNTDVLATLTRRCLPERTTVVTAPRANTREEAITALRESGVPLENTAIPEPVKEQPVNAEPVPAPEPVNTTPDPEPADPGSRAELLDELRSLYADLLDVPEEMLDDEVDLEADLGIDSIRQVESFTHLRKRFDLEEPPEDLRVTSYTTLPRIADLVDELKANA